MAQLIKEKTDSPEAVATCIQWTLEYIDPERVVVAPDCGMKYLLSPWHMEKCAPWW